MTLLRLFLLLNLLTITTIVKLFIFLVNIVIKLVFFLISIIPKIVSLRTNQTKPISKTLFSMQAVRPESESQLQEEAENQNTDYNARNAQSHSASSQSSAGSASAQELLEYICAGPLINKMGLNREKVAQDLHKWTEYGSLLSNLFQFNESNLTGPQKGRLYHYYIPVFIWCENQISQHRSRFSDGEEVPPLVIGFSAPQGCGKSTLVLALDHLFGATKRNTATISIDDFYLTAEGQAKLREANPGNALLEFRGNAGSHDLRHSAETLTGLTKLTKKGMKMQIPRYDKSAYGGRGDVGDRSTWPEVEGPLMAVLFEGWMLGFKPVPERVIEAVNPQLGMVNKNLEAYHDAWHKFIESWIVIKIKDPSYVYQWRLQAEISMKKEGNTGLSNAEVDDFVSRYMPAYKAYLPTLYTEGPSGSDPKRCLVVDIDAERNPILAE